MDNLQILHDWIIANTSITDKTANAIIEQIVGLKQQPSPAHTEVTAELIAFGKRCFYKGFDKSENDDANCYTAWREEAKKLISSLPVQSPTDTPKGCKHKPFIVANVREIIEKEFDETGIVSSRMVEVFNEVAEKYYAPAKYSVEDMEKCWDAALLWYSETLTNMNMIDNDTPDKTSYINSTKQ